MRRIVQYRNPGYHYDQPASAKDIAPQCMMWLRRTRSDFPSLEELVQDLKRQQQMKILAQQADERWRKGSLLQNHELNDLQREQLKKVTQGLHENNLKTQQEDEKLAKSHQEQTHSHSHVHGENCSHTHDSNPFENAQSKEDPIEQAAIKPRRR